MKKSGCLIVPLLVLMGWGLAVLGADPVSDPQGIAPEIEADSQGFIGVMVDPVTDGVQVWAVVWDSPAAAAGIKIGDIVTEVDGTSLQGLQVQDAVALLRGEIGSTARLKVFRSGFDAPLLVDVVREEPPLRPQLLPEGGVAANKSADRLPYQRIDRREPDLQALDQIVLLPSPTKDQVREYVEEIAIVSSNQTVLGPKDPQVSMLVKVGPENVDVLLDATWLMPYFIVWALDKLADESHKEMIFDALSRNSVLVKVVLAKGWLQDARPILIEGLGHHSQVLPREWIEAVAAFRDPQTYEDLKDYLINGPNHETTYRAIQTLPGIDLTDAVARAWQRARSDPSQQEWTSMAPVALEFGHLDALELVVNSLGLGPNDPEQIRDARALALRHTDAHGSNEQIQQWFRENRDRLVFDPATKKFRPNDVTVPAEQPYVDSDPQCDYIASVKILSIKPGTTARLKTNEPLTISLAYTIRSTNSQIWVLPAAMRPSIADKRNADHGFGIQLTSSKATQGTGILETAITYAYRPEQDKAGADYDSFVRELTTHEVLVIADNEETKDSVILLTQPVAITWEAAKPPRRSP